MTFLLLAYLALAASWAGASTNQLLVRQPSVQGMPLSPRQLDILLRIEDPTFFSHRGLSLGDGQGVATISSAVARELLLYGPGLEGFKGMLQGFYRGVFECCKKIDLGRDAMAQLVTMIRAPNALHPVRKRAQYEARLARVRAVLARRCRPAGWFDTTYAHCSN